MLPFGLRGLASGPFAPRPLGAGLLALALAIGFGGLRADYALAAEALPVRDLSYEGRRHTLVLAIAGGVTVTTRALKAPLRLVVDLAGASWTAPRRELVINDGLVRRVRIAQYQLMPPVVRLVIEPATVEEPTLAIQQTGQRVYITLAPSRAGSSPAGTQTHTPPPSLAVPTPRPVAPTPRPAATPRPTPTPRAGAAAVAPPTRLWLRTRLTPEGWTAPEPSPTPRPAPAATPRPVRTAPPTPFVAPATPGGDLETMPDVPTGARLGEGA